MTDHHRWLQIARADGLEESAADLVTLCQGDEGKANDFLGRAAQLYLRQYDFCEGLAAETRTREAVRAGLAALLQTSTERP